MNEPPLFPFITTTVKLVYKSPLNTTVFQLPVPAEQDFEPLNVTYSLLPTGGNQDGTFALRIIVCACGGGGGGGGGVGRPCEARCEGENGRTGRGGGLGMRASSSSCCRFVLCFFFGGGRRGFGCDREGRCRLGACATWLMDEVAAVLVLGAQNNTFIPVVYVNASLGNGFTFTLYNLVSDRAMRAFAWGVQCV